MSVNDLTRRGLMASMAAGAAVTFAGCAPRPQPTGHAFDPGQFQRWDESDPPFRIYPGDEVEVTLHSATELSRTVRVGPDGRVNLPMVGAVMVSGRTMSEATAEITDRYSRVLVDPVVELLPASFGPQSIIVGGEVANPGLVELPGPRIGALEAVMLAGGFQPTARRNEVAVLRRANDGGVMLRTVDLHAPLTGRGQDSIPLVRHDLVFVPRSTIAEVNLWVNQYVRGILPLDAGFNYLIYESFRD
jgi:polysaccharide biosynthesis/export protein PslD